MVVPRSSAPAVAVALLALLPACPDDAPRHPPPPPRDDAGAFDAAAPPDASADPDATVDADGGAGWTTVHRDYGTEFDACPALRMPLWGDLRWTATIPEGASIRFSAQAAPAGESLSSASRVTIGTTPPDTPPIYVADQLAVEHRNDPQLRITAQLIWSSADAQPTLDSINLDWQCLDRP